MTNDQKERLALLRADANPTKKEKAELAELEAIEAAELEAMETTNAPGSVTEFGDAPAGGDSVYVFANLEGGQKFKLPSGEVVEIAGMPVSSLKLPAGGFYPGGKYGITRVRAEAWAEVVRIYGKMKMFVNGLVFAAETLERGQAMARERGGLRHGFEPIDPNSNRVKSSPKTDD